MSQQSETTSDEFEDTLALARDFQADTSRAEFGFETRLAARLADLRREGLSPAGNLWDEALTWLWGGAAGTAPVVAGLAVWFFIANGLNIHLDSNIGSLFHHLTSYLPFSVGE